VLTQLPADFPLPILLVQHMPGSFTAAFAARLNSLCQITVKEAQDGDVLTPGTALLAPGGFQMLLEKSGARQIVRIMESEPGQNYKPCVDITFDSIFRLEPAHTLAIIMTGMGADGCEGVRHLKQGGSTVWAQDEASCVVYGMPGAVVEAGLADEVLPVDEIGKHLAQVH
jgi:two-component system chemotaxis response regulator CheB